MGFANEINFRSGTSCDLRLRDYGLEDLAERACSVALECFVLTWWYWGIGGCSGQDGLNQALQHTLETLESSKDHNTHSCRLKAPLGCLEFGLGIHPAGLSCSARTPEALGKNRFADPWTVCKCCPDPLASSLIISEVGLLVLLRRRSVSKSAYCG